MMLTSFPFADMGSEALNGGPGLMGRPSPPPTPLGLPSPPMVNSKANSFTILSENDEPILSPQSGNILVLQFFYSLCTSIFFVLQLHYVSPQVHFRLQGTQAR